MTLRRPWKLSLLTLCFALLVSAPVRADAEFKPKLKEGTSTSESVIKFEQAISIAGMNNKSSSENSRKQQTTIGKKDGLGRTKVEQKVTKMGVRQSANGLDYTFDSDNPDTAGTSPFEILRPLHKAMSGMAIGMVYDKDNEIAEIELDQQIVNGLPMQLRDLVKGDFDTNRMKSRIKASRDRYPTNAVKTGESWTKSDDFPLGSGQIMKLQIKYTYEGPVDRNGKKVEKITSVVESVEISTDETAMQIKIGKSELKPQDSKGTILYDTEIGDEVEEVSVVHAVGTFELEINGMKLPAELDLKMESSQKRLD